MHHLIPSIVPAVAFALTFIAASAEAQSLDPRSTPIYRKCRAMATMSVQRCICMTQSMGRPANETLITTLMQAYSIDKLRGLDAAQIAQVHAKGIFAPEGEIYAAAGSIVAAADDCG